MMTVRVIILLIQTVIIVNQIIERMHNLIMMTMAPIRMMIDSKNYSPTPILKTALRILYM